MAINLNQMKALEKEMKRFLMSYKFGLEEMKTKINILNEEFKYIHDYNPIEHIKSRIKSPESIFEKLERNNLEISLDSVRENITDIAGIRIVCSFVSDIYIISEMLEKQQDLKVIKYRDYIKNPKESGYQSLHLIVQVPVFMSDRVEDVCVEVQIRTIGMDFWASLEHKIYYKYNGVAPERLKNELKETANIISHLDERMENMNSEISKIKDSSKSQYNVMNMIIGDAKLKLPGDLLDFDDN